MRFTKTFTQAIWYHREEGDADKWGRLAVDMTRDEMGSYVPIDQQVAMWVRETRAVIIHPGQLGIHTQWQDKELTLKCVTLGLTVLYMEGDDVARQRQETGEDAQGLGQEADINGATPFADPDFTDREVAGGGTTDHPATPYQPATRQPTCVADALGLPDASGVPRAADITAASCTSGRTACDPPATGGESSGTPGDTSVVSTSSTRVRRRRQRPSPKSKHDPAPGRPALPDGAL